MEKVSSDLSSLFYIVLPILIFIVAKKQKNKQLHHVVHRRVRLAVVPHKENEYRPHIIRRYGLTAILFAVAVLQVLGGALSPSAILGDTSPITSEELLTQTNNQRQTSGLPSLQLNDKLSKAAYYKAKDMFASQYWAHTSPSGVQPWKWLGDVDYNYAKAGENLAKNFSSSHGVMGAWMDSAAHKENILKAEYQDVGFAVVDGTLNNRPASIVVALYATPATGAVQGAHFAAATEESLSFVAQLGRNIQTASPSLIGSVVLLLSVAMVATTAHAYRKRLPKSLQRTWYRHHGAYKAVGLVSLVVVIVTIYSSSAQI